MDMVSVDESTGVADGDSLSDPAPFFHSGRSRRGTEPVYDVTISTSCPSGSFPTTFFHSGSLAVLATHSCKKMGQKGGRSLRSRPFNLPYDVTISTSCPSGSLVKA